MISVKKCSLFPAYSCYASKKGHYSRLMLGIFFFRKRSRNLCGNIWGRPSTEYGIMMETSGAIALQCPVVTRKKFDQEAA